LRATSVGCDNYIAFKNWKEAAMTFYCGIDLHTKKSQLCIIDKDGKKVKEGNLNNDLSVIFEFLEPFGRDVHSAIECTTN
jgi:hypothetical protein